MNTVVIFAGGTGQRMRSPNNCPKQFMEVRGKPIIIHTLEVFQVHPEIDRIVVVCLESWIEHCRELIAKYGITKVVSVVPGGESGQQSICNGLCEAMRQGDPSDTVLIHDGVRPIIDPETISAAIESVRIHGSGITSAPAIETIVVGSENGKIGQILNRSLCSYAKAPQCFVLKDIVAAHQRAIQEGKHDFIDSAALMSYYGHTLYTVQGKSENIKITTMIDYYMFQAILEARERQAEG